MKRKLLLMALATCVIATMFIGCGKESDYSTTTPDTNVEQDGNSNVDDTTKEDATSKDNSSKEEVKGYDEVFYDEPNWEVEYEGKSELFIETMKLEYDAMKFVFEDMTQNFKHKKEVTATDEIWIGHIGTQENLTFVCDIDNVMIEGLTNSDGEPIVWKKDLYPEFAGFKVSKTSATSWLNDPVIKVVLNAPYVDGQCPLAVTAYVVKNDDGTYTYKSISFISNNNE